jgi:hypothetical protein
MSQEAVEEYAEALRGGARLPPVVVFYDGTVRWLADGFEAGYVWDEHEVSVGNKKMRKPKADGWYEHGQVCAQYLELNFGGRGVKTTPPVEFTTPARPPSGGPMGWGY